MDVENEEISFLRPRDPSLNNEHLTFESIRVNLARSTSQEECLGKNQVPGSMQIYLRMKKSKRQSDELYEVNEKTIVCRAPGAEFEKRYKFSNIFKADSTQADLFNAVVKPKVFQFIGGKSSSLFAYGASGSGKTFTMMGTAAQPGIVPRTLEYLFRSLPEIPDNISFKPDATDDIVFLSPADQLEQKRIRDRLLQASSSTIDKHHIQTFKAMQQRLSTEQSATVEDQDELFLGVWVSFAEIYNEDVFDLLKPQASKKKPREKLAIKMSGARPHIKDLTTVNTSSSLEAYQMLQYGLHNLKYASTCVNFHSSRSHSVFTIKLIQGSFKTKEYIISYFNFCDLAGSERLKRTMNTGERLKESNSINTSLLVLGKCIRSILSSQKSKDNRPVPYRESKLTQLFQRALRGLEDIAMIVNVNPEKEVFEETLHALNFSAIAKEVKVNNAAKIVKQMESDESEASQGDAEIGDLEELLLELTDELEGRESEFQDEMILMRSQMMDECHKAMARANKEYEKEVKRIAGYYEDLFEEELELWKQNYEEESPGGVNEDDVIVVLDSSGDESPGGVNEDDVIVVLDSSEDESPGDVNEDDVSVVLDSSEDEESFKRGDLERQAQSVSINKLEDKSSVLEAQVDCKREMKKSASTSEEQLKTDEELKTDRELKSKASNMKKSASTSEEQLKTDEELKTDGKLKSKASDKLITESSKDSSLLSKEEKSKISFEIQGYSDDDDGYLVETKKSSSSLEVQSETIDFSSPAQLEDTNDDYKERIKKSASMLDGQLDEGEHYGELKSKATEGSTEGSSLESKEEKSETSFELQDYSDDDDDSFQLELKISTSLLEAQRKTMDFSSPAQLEETQNNWKGGIKKSASMLEEQLKTEHYGELKSKTSDKLVAKTSTDGSLELKEEKPTQFYSEEDNYESEFKKFASFLEAQRTTIDYKRGQETSKPKLEISDESMTDDSSAGHSSSSSFVEDLIEAKTKLRESLSLLEMQDYSNDDNYEEDVEETRTKITEDECNHYLRKSFEKLINRTITKSVTKSIEESQVETLENTDYYEVDSDQSVSMLETSGDLRESIHQSRAKSNPIDLESSKSDLEEFDESIGDLKESVDQSKTKSFGDRSPIRFDPKSKDLMDELSEDVDHMNIIEEIFT